MTAPDLTRHVQGQGSVSADQLNTFAQTCNTVAELRDFIPTIGIMVYMRGISTSGDGGQGWFWWNSSSSATDNGVTTGAWLRLPYIIGVPTVVTAVGAYTVVASDDVVYINKTSGAATTVNLPSSPRLGETHTIKDMKGDAASNNITITPAGGYLIDGAATLVISTNYQSRKVQFNGSSWSAIG